MGDNNCNYSDPVLCLHADWQTVYTLNSLTTVPKAEDFNAPGMGGTAVGAAMAVYKLKKAITDLASFADECNKQAKEKESIWNLEGLIGQPSKIIAMGKQATELGEKLQAVAEQMPNVAQTILNIKSFMPGNDAERDEWIKQGGEQLEGMKKYVEFAGSVLEYAKDLVAGAELLQSAVDCHTQVQQFTSGGNPTAQSMEAWATSVGDVFDKFGTCVGFMSKIPGCELLNVYSDYLKVPKVVIGVFIQCQHTYYDGMDKAIKDAVNAKGNGGVLQPGTSEGDPTQGQPQTPPSQ